MRDVGLAIDDVGAGGPARSRACRPRSTEITGSREPWLIATGSPASPASWSSKSGTVGMKPLMARRPAGRGRPGPSASAHAITAPWEKPPSTVRSIGTPVRSASPSSHEPEPLERRRERLRVRVADLLDHVPVVADRRQLQGPARERADEPLARVEDVEQREQVLLGGAAPVQQHDRAGGVALGRPQLVDEIVDVSHER